MSVMPRLPRKGEERASKHTVKTAYHKFAEAVLKGFLKSGADAGNSVRRDGVGGPSEVKTAESSRYFATKFCNEVRFSQAYFSYMMETCFGQKSSKDS